MYEASVCTPCVDMEDHHYVEKLQDERNLKWMKCLNDNCLIINNLSLGSSLWSIFKVFCIIIHEIVVDLRKHRAR